MNAPRPDKINAPRPTKVLVLALAGLALSAILLSWINTTSPVEKVSVVPAEATREPADTMILFDILAPGANGPEVGVYRYDYQTHLITWTECIRWLTDIDNGPIQMKLLISP